MHYLVNMLQAIGKGGIELLLEVRRHCLLYTSDAADERSSVDLGGRRIIKKKKTQNSHRKLRSKTKYHTRQKTEIRKTDKTLQQT